MSSGKTLPAVKVEGSNPVLPTVNARAGVDMPMRLDQANLSAILSPKRVYGEAVDSPVAGQKQTLLWTVQSMF